MQDVTPDPFLRIEGKGNKAAKAP